MSHLIDAKGKACPIPVVLAKGAITDGADAFTIEVDNTTAVENLTRLAASQGYGLAVRESGGIFALDFARTGAVVKPQASAPAETCTGCGYAVLVGRDTLGAGDRALGTNLMRMFFYSLANSCDLPACVLFLNDGVKLPTLDDQMVEHLNALSGKGVEILVCGTCLNFYGLSEQLRVGTVSNMFDILSRMQGSGKVITL